MTNAFQLILIVSILNKAVSIASSLTPSWHPVQLGFSNFPFFAYSAVQPYCIMVLFRCIFLWEEKVTQGHIPVWWEVASLHWKLLVRVWSREVSGRTSHVLHFCMFVPKWLLTNSGGVFEGWKQGHLLLMKSMERVDENWRKLEVGADESIGNLGEKLPRRSPFLFYSISINSILPNSPRL